METGVDCMSCMHLRRIRIDPTSLESKTVCVHSPPVPVAIHAHGQVKIQSMFPLVGEGVWCAKHFTKPDPKLVA